MKISTKLSAPPTNTIQLPKFSTVPTLLIDNQIYFTPLSIRTKLEHPPPIYRVSFCLTNPDGLQYQIYSWHEFSLKFHQIIQFQCREQTLSSFYFKYNFVILQSEDFIFEVTSLSVINSIVSTVMIFPVSKPTRTKPLFQSNLMAVISGTFVKLVENCTISVYFLIWFHKDRLFKTVYSFKSNKNKQLLLVPTITDWPPTISTHVILQLSYIYSLN